MNTEQIDQILEYLRKFGESAATKGYKIVFKQVIYDGIINWLCINLGIVMMLLSVIYIQKFDWGNIDSVIGCFYVLINWLVLISGMLLTIFNGKSLVNIVINPDWMAIKLITKLISGK